MSVGELRFAGPHLVISPMSTLQHWPGSRSSKSYSELLEVLVGVFCGVGSARYHVLNMSYNLPVSWYRLGRMFFATLTLTLYGGL